MRKLFLPCLMALCCLNLYAQRELKNPLIDSKIIIDKGSALHDEGKYKQAIAEYLKVPESDTSYSLILHELILSLYSDSNYTEAEKYSHKALELFPDEKYKWYNFLANIYDDTERQDLAIKAYDTVLAQNPYSYTAWFNKGIALFRQSRHEEAEEHFKKCIILNPYYASAHYFLGQIALLKGRLVEAMLSFTSNLIISPTNRYYKKSIAFLQMIAEINTETKGYLTKYKPGKEDDFDDIQEILVSKVSLDKKYKIKTSLEDPIVRQIQVVMEKLEYNASDKGFWMQFYVPFYKQIWANGQFETMTYYMFSALDIKKAKEYVAKEKKKIEVFSVQAVEYFNSIQKTQELYFTKRENSKQLYYIKNYSIYGKGPVEINKKNEIMLSGPWEYYFENGKVRSKGNFDNESLRTGLWNYYYNSGLLKESTQYLKDKENGKSELWNDNGNLYSSSTYVNGIIEGTSTLYFYNGRLQSIINYKAGKKEGEAKYFHINGYLRTVANYKNDLQDGIETLYYENGKVESTLNYLKDIPIGDYKEFFKTGELRESGSYTDGKKSGTWKTYYVDGKPDYIENFVKGELDGEWLSYYSNGKLASRRNFKKGNSEGKAEDFADDGKIYSETIFERGRLKDIKFFDKSGNIISNTTSRKGNANIVFYSSDGVKTSQGYYTKDGLAEGEFIYYYGNGEISAKGSYKNGLQDGNKTFYYPNKAIKQEARYKENVSNGYFIDYHINGQVSGEGWFIEGLRQGTFINYNALGKITARTYYLNDKKHGLSEVYSASGKREYIEYYDMGWLNKIDQFDSTGKLIQSNKLDRGKGKVMMMHYNGKTNTESNYTHYVRNGTYKITNGDGSKRGLIYFKNDNMDSVYTYWYPNGKIEVEGSYNNGQKTGVWKYYSIDGKLTQQIPYNNGNIDGEYLVFNTEGKIINVYNYKKGAMDGDTKYFDDNGQLLVSIFFKDDVVKSYSYEDKTGKLVTAIPLLNGSGKIVSYYKNGTKSAEIDYNESEVDGERKMYFDNGKEKSSVKRISGYDHGVFKTFYPSGKIKAEENYYYGEKHGSVKHYNENGTLKQHLNYYMDELHGECHYYTDGKLAGTYIYYHGVLQSKK